MQTPGTRTKNINNRIKDKKAMDLMDQVLDYARCVCPNVDELMQQAKFPKFKEK